MLALHFKYKIEEKKNRAENSFKNTLKGKSSPSTHASTADMDVVQAHFVETRLLLAGNRKHQPRKQHKSEYDPACLQSHCAYAP